MKNGYRVVVPESYKHLCQLAGKDAEHDRSCVEFHHSFSSRLILAFLLVNLFGLLGLLVSNFAFPGHHSYFLPLFLPSLVSASILGFALGRLYKRNWMKAHSYKVITDLIPRYLHKQINLTEASLIGHDSPLHIVSHEVLKVKIKGAYQQESIARFRLTLGEKEKLPRHLAYMLEEAEGYLKFAEVHNLLLDSASFVFTFLETKRKEVGKFRDWAYSNDVPAYVVVQEAWLRESQSICSALSLLSKVFNKYFEESGVSLFGSAEELSEDGLVDTAKEQAGCLLKLLNGFYPNKYTSPPTLDSTKKEDSPKAEESKPNENPAAEGGVLSEADLKELEDLERGLNK